MIPSTGSSSIANGQKGIRRNGSIRVMSNMADPSVIQPILDHLGIWIIKSRPLPVTTRNFFYLTRVSAHQRPCSL
jgi:hypothetical protein